MNASLSLGFVSAVLPDDSLDEILATTVDLGYDCVELMCWPPGDADRRYTGVTHIDVDSIGDGADLKQQITDSGVTGTSLHPPADPCKTGVFSCAVGSACDPVQDKTAGCCTGFLTARRRREARSSVGSRCGSIPPDRET